MKTRSIILVFLLTSMFSMNLCLAQNDSAKFELNDWKHKISLGTNVSPFWPLISDKYRYNRGTFAPVLEYELKLNEKSLLRGVFSFNFLTDTNGQLGPFPQQRKIQLRRSYAGIEYKRNLFNIRNRTSIYVYTGLIWIQLTSDTTFTPNMFRRGPSWSSSLAGEFGLGVEYYVSKHFGISMESDVIAIFERSGRTYYRKYPPPTVLVTEKSKYYYAGLSMFRLFGLKISYRF